MSRPPRPTAKPIAETGHDAHDAAGDHGAGEQAAGVAFVDMPDLIVNLQSAAPRLRYLKLRLSLEVADPAAAEAVGRLMPRVLDSFQLYLRALTLEDVQGAAGMQRLKEELTARVNLAVAAHAGEHGAAQGNAGPVTGAGGAERWQR